MKVLAVYARLYGQCAVAAAKAIGKSPWTLALPALALFLLTVAAILLASLGLVGGFGLAFVRAGLLSGYFYFVAESASGSRLALGEIGKSLRKYVWSFINLSFVLWIAELVLSAVLNGPNAELIFNGLKLVAFILLNAAPEMITQRGTSGGLATIQGSIEFIQENWVEWFIPNLFVGALLYFGLPFVRAAALLMASGVLAAVLPAIAKALLISAVLQFLALYRTFLFVELVGSTHRQRMFKFRKQ